MDVSIADKWTLISQLYAPTDDGLPSENRFEDCGETCVCMIERYLYGPGPQLVSPDTVKDRILGQNKTGYSYITQLSNYLADHDIPNHWWAGSNAGADAPTYADALAKGHPNIALFYWDVAVPTSGHFCNITAIEGDGHWTRANPWTDALERETPAWVARWYKGCGLIVDIDPATFRQKMGIAPPPAPPAPAPRFRVLYDGALHPRPTISSPATYHIKKGWTLVAVSGDSTPWISVKTLDGHWGWTTRVELERIA